MAERIGASMEMGSVHRHTDSGVKDASSVRDDEIASQKCDSVHDACSEKGVLSSGDDMDRPAGYNPVSTIAARYE
jgi:hypothetical protein